MIHTKEAGLFTKKKPTLDPQLFNLQTKKLRLSTIITILTMATNLIPPELYYSMMAMGSSITHYWEPDSDIDIQIMLMTPEYVKAYADTVKAFNRSGENFLPGTEHPVNFFLMPKFEHSNFDNLEAGYDIVNNKWIKDPQDIPHSVQNELRMSGAYIDLLNNKMKRELEQLKENTSLENLKDVGEIYKRIDADRKLSYSFLPKPRYSPANIVYKSVEKRTGDIPERIFHLMRAQGIR